MTSWHAIDPTDVPRRLGVDPARGLSGGEIPRRRAESGPNELPAERSRGWWAILADQFANIVIALLAVAAAISWLSGSALEAGAIVVVLVINAAVGFATEFEAGRALDALRKQVRSTARIRRDGAERVVDAVELVPGDVVLLQAGDSVPADLRLLLTSQLRTQEAGLTGESAPVSKNSDPVPEETLLADRRSMAWLGTTVVGGRGEGIVIATGTNSEMGRIGSLIHETEDERTPLEVRLAALGRKLVLLVLVIAAVVIVAGLLRGEQPWQMAKVGISLAVAAVPEGLPAVTTLILAIGVLRMARRRAIVRRLASVETLGSTTVICSDKTGTLTMNRMSVRELPDEPEAAERLLRDAVLCSDAIASIGDPTEIALLDAAAERGIDAETLRRACPRIAEEPFDSETKRMITMHETPDGQLVIVKGAPGVVLDLCAMDAEERARLDRQNGALADRALRVLAVADRRGNGPLDDPSFSFAGFVGMIDPPRPEVAGAIEDALRAGIRIVMLTGDQAGTARAIARELRLTGDREPVVLHANELRDASVERFAEVAATTDVFARVSPEDKLRIVEALRAAGEIVAVTGDGVNDAPALKRADIGVAMGERGTEVAKEASDLVLADDNFATIVAAIEGGRTIYANIVKFVHLMFSHNLAEVLVVFVAVAGGWPLPLFPLQILWINLVTDVFPALALALEPPSPRSMQQPPRSTKSSLVSRDFMVLIGWQAAMLATITLAGYQWALERYGEGAHARTVAVLALIGVQLGHLFNCRSRVHSAFERITGNPFLWVAAAAVVGLQVLAIGVPALARVLDLVRPNAADLTVIIAAVALPIVIVEMQKWFVRRRESRQPARPPAGRR